MKSNERGFTLVELLVWLVIMAILSLLVGNILKLQIQAKNNTDVSKFYDELALVDSYISEMVKEDVETTYTETQLEITSSTHIFKLSKTSQGVFMDYKEISTGTSQSTRLKFVKSIKISKLSTLVLKGDKGGSDFIYRVPVKSAFQIFFNDEYLEENWFKEVITYVI